MTHTEEPRAEPGARVPAVSVIIPAYGVNAYLAEAVDSVLAQTFKDYEIVVVNDGAPPEETAEMKRILSRYGSSVVYLERENGGQAAARNTAIRARQSPYIALLDGDDCWGPTLLERQMEMLTADPTLDLVYCDARLFGDGEGAGTTFMQQSPSDGPVTLANLITRRCNVLMSTIVMRREAVVAAGLFDESLRYCEDLEMWLRMAYRGSRMAYRREALAYRRVRGTSLTADGLKLARGVLEVFERFGQSRPLREADRAELAHMIAKTRSHIGLLEGKRNLSAGDFAAAGRTLRQIDPQHVNLKVRLARVGLGTVPVAIGVAYRVWTRLLGLRSRAQTARLSRRAAADEL